MLPPTAQLIEQKILSQARGEGISLSQVEPSMLLFSKTSRTLSNIVEVNGAFDRDYARASYESKVTNLVRHLRFEERHNPDANRSWNGAMSNLRDGDCYVLALINEACGKERPRGDLILLVVTAIVIVCIILGSILFFTSR